MDAWYARYAEDIAWAGQHAKRVVHLGDWLVETAFPMAQGSDTRTLNIGDEVWNNLPLDHTIQQIQQFRRVHSARLHPLLCALTSATEVSYAEQPHPQTGQPSGNFRSMLLDVFAATCPQACVLGRWSANMSSPTMRVRRRSGMSQLRADLALSHA